jgi:tetratricopeptide (TPR) repeat protein
LQCAPNNAAAWNNRAAALLTLARYEAAVSAFDQALELRPPYIKALIGQALAKKQLGCFDEALVGLDAALAIDPQSDHIKSNKAVVLLQRGDFEKGWDLYESIASRTPKHAPRLPIPEWGGQALADKNIVVFDEQGFGDAIRFVRFCLELVKQRHLFLPGAPVSTFPKPADPPHRPTSIRRFEPWRTTSIT